MKKESKTKEKVKESGNPNRETDEGSARESRKSQREREQNKRKTIAVRERQKKMRENMRRVNTVRRVYGSVYKRQFREFGLSGKSVLVQYLPNGKNSKIKNRGKKKTSYRI